jgi:hypothetical protein
MIKTSLIGLVATTTVAAALLAGTVGAATPKTAPSCHELTHQASVPSGQNHATYLLCASPADHLSSGHLPTVKAGQLSAAASSR